MRPGRLLKKMRFYRTWMPSGGPLGVHKAGPPLQGPLSDPRLSGG